MTAVSRAFRCICTEVRPLKQLDLEHNRRCQIGDIVLRAAPTERYRKVRDPHSVSDGDQTNQLAGPKAEMTVKSPQHERDFYLQTQNRMKNKCTSIHLKTLRLFRRKEHSDLLDIAVFFQDQLNRYGMLHGYKMMHLKCIQAGYVVTQETIRQLLKILDPHGVQLRRRNRLRRQISTMGFPATLTVNSKTKPISSRKTGVLSVTPKQRR
ncbi:hypothetical protein F2P79_016065 [Pimephales promelas]|nr:hypothetical protein F2P79_016065 [Pimephales promelas]